MATGWILASQILNLTNILLTFLFGIVSEFLLIYGVLVDVFLKGLLEILGIASISAWNWVLLLIIGIIKFLVYLSVLSVFIAEDFIGVDLLTIPNLPDKIRYVVSTLLVVINGIVDVVAAFKMRTEPHPDKVEKQPKQKRFHHKRHSSPKQ